MVRKIVAPLIAQAGAQGHAAPATQLAGICAALCEETEKKTVVSLIGLARPFPKLKALDMDKVCADVVAAL